MVMLLPICCMCNQANNWLTRSPSNGKMSCHYFGNSFWYCLHKAPNGSSSQQTHRIKILANFIDNDDSLYIVISRNCRRDSGKGNSGSGSGVVPCTSYT